MEELELTILMPCLNEEATIATCIRKAKRFLADFGVRGEVLVADNGSTDASREIAIAEGARIVAVVERGYGAALRGGYEVAQGRFIVMGDADDLYDFYTLMPFLERLREGSDLVMGNRFRGGVARGAMPFLHQYLGNPVLSWLGRLFFRISIGDFHCGLRGFNRDSIMNLHLHTTGMEFASEMVVRCALADYRIDEVPVTLKKDGRARSPHLRTWRDGWRHLSFLLMYSPKWLFLYPGLALFGAGAAAIVFLFPGMVKVAGVGFDIHSFLVGCIATLIGVQSISFALIARRFATQHNLLPASKRFLPILDALTLERVLVVGGVLACVGFGGFVWCVRQWAAVDFGPLHYSQMLRVLILSLTAIAIGIQLVLTAFLSAIISIKTR